MEALHSYSLALSLAALVGALALGLVSQRADDASRQRRLRHATATVADLSLVLIILSMCVHLIFDHRPGTEDQLAFVTFFVTHRAFLIVPVAATAVGQWGRRGTVRPPG